MTTNIISTPEITGNIGSCTTQKVTAVSGRDSLLTVNVVDVTTNSCTGEVTTYNYWEFSGIFYTIFISVVFVTYVAIKVFGGRDNY